jgi:hypothetical protein
MTNKYPDLSRTAKALEEWDQAEPALSAELMLARSNEEMQEIMQRMRAAGRKVAEAFAADTSDRNSHDNGILGGWPTIKQRDPSDDCFVRRCVTQWKAQEQNAPVEEDETA